MEPVSKSNTYAVIANYDAFGGGYLVQSTAYLATAIADGWQVLVSGLEYVIANRIAETYRNAGKVEATATPDLSDLLTYDMTLPIENRQSESAQEFDLVAVEYKGRIIEGTITFFDEYEVEIDGCFVMSRAAFLKTATLIAKADDDSGFLVEYNEYLTELDQNWSELYEVAAIAQNGIAA